MTVNSIVEETQAVCNKTVILSRNTSQFIQANNYFNASELVIANIVGSWNENSESDKTIISQLIREEYSDWVIKLRDIVQQPESPIVLKNGIWNIKDREKLWQALGTRIFDDNLNSLKKCIVTVLTECDPRFELPKKEQCMANIHGKVFKYSYQLKKGFAESLALLECFSNNLKNCSFNKAKDIVVLSVREIFNEADWVLWASLNDLLPLIAEATPNEFLKIVEDALQQEPCPFDSIFAQESNGITGGNYLTGLLWALETLAWEEDFLIRVVVILGELANRDPGGNWGNRPSNSLSTILLPWYPQTIATIEKRTIAVQTLEKELPNVAWKLLLILLSSQNQISTGSHKPKWRKSIPEEWTGKVFRKEYREQIIFYAKFAVEKAKNNINRLKTLISNFNNLPKPAFDTLLTYLTSDFITTQPEDTKMSLWTELVKFTTEHKRFSDAKWALDSKLIEEIDKVANKLEPTNPLNLYARLFNERDFDLYEKNGDYQEQGEILEEKRQQALRHILTDGGIDAVFNFLNKVESSSTVGLSLAKIADDSIDTKVIPAYLDYGDNKLEQFAGAYIWNRYQQLGWNWVDNVNIEGWSKSQITRFYTFLPFTLGTWQRVSKILSEHEDMYWTQAGVNPYQAECELKFAIDKLIEYDRPHAAIHCIYKEIHDKRPLDTTKIIHVLMSIVSSQELLLHVDTYQLTEIIKTLQNDSSVNSDDLFRVEWAYLSLLDGHNGVTPKYLENRLSTDSEFFCEVIRLVYRSKNVSKTEQKTTEQEKMIATNAWHLLNDRWRTPPGIQADGSFEETLFEKWITETQNICSKTGHLEVALSNIGKVLFYCPSDPSGLWINKSAVNALNKRDAEEMRNGFCSAIFNSRGVYSVEPTGKPERKLAEKYRQQANDVENEGFQRLAASLRGIADSYDREADRRIDEHKFENGE